MSLRNKNNSLTVGKLLDFIKKNNISDDAIVFVERIEDIYFEKYHWETVGRKGFHYAQALKWNEDIDSGKYLDKQNYPNIKPEHLIKYTDEQLESLKDQFFIADSCCGVNEDKNLYIHGHY